jgi:futalosine hydrolase
VKVLFVAATRLEVADVAARLRFVEESGPRATQYTHRGHEVTLLTTGVGMVATACWCSRALATGSYDVAINAGVCGAFNRALPVGSAVHVVSDRIAELGAEDRDRFLTVHELDLLDENEFPFTHGLLVNPAPLSNPVIARLPAAQAITVNTAHGNEASIQRVVERWNPDVESMEGAAFMYACLIHGVPFAQVRAVSNVVEARNRSHWKLAEAIDRLADHCVELLSTL